MGFNSGFKGLRHGEQGAAENWGGMTSLPGRGRECGGGEGGCCALFCMRGTAPLRDCDG